MTAQLSSIYKRTGIAALACMSASIAQSYPLQDDNVSGIRRLQGYLHAQQQPTGAKLVRGALLSADQISLGLQGLDIPDFDTQAQDPDLTRVLAAMFQGRDPSYAVVVVDISDPTRVRWAGLKPDTRQNVGSVGKVLTMIGLFDALAEAFPDVEDRQRVLATTLIRGGDWVLGDEHQVPRLDTATGANRFARLNAADEFYLSEWLDHAISASANGAGSVVWREAMLIRHFGNRYPVSQAEADAYLQNTPKAQLSALALDITSRALQAADIDTGNIRQGSLWTGTGKNKVPGTSSFATPRELARVMFRLEQGRLVDTWSSLEMKKYLYMTKRRYRYVYAPELNDSAAFFKSGSLYSCVAEEGFRCGRYMGNNRNFMNSVATIETPAGPNPTSRYIVSLISNVLRFNSAWDHSRFAAAIHEAVRSGEAVTVRESASAAELEAVIKSD
jgi:hypothetical protein